jgi:hypothetical protein
MWMGEVIIRYIYNRVTTSSVLCLTVHNPPAAHDLRTAGDKTGHLSCVFFLTYRPQTCILQRITTVRPKQPICHNPMPESLPPLSFAYLAATAKLHGRPLDPSEPRQLGDYLVAVPPPSCTVDDLDSCQKPWVLTGRKARRAVATDRRVNGRRRLTWIVSHDFKGPGAWRPLDSPAWTCPDRPLLVWHRPIK